MNLMFYDVCNKTESTMQELTAILSHENNCYTLRD